MKKIVLFAVIAVSLTSGLLAAEEEYRMIREVSGENDSYVVANRHDWSPNTRDRRLMMMAAGKNPFSEENNYSRLRCINLNTAKVVFNVPSPAFTYLWISENSNCIVGLSKIKLTNPYNFVVFDGSGNVLYKEFISPLSAYSKKIKESPTNYVYWYKEDDPKIACTEENGKITAVSLLDPQGERFTIQINKP